MLLLEYRHGVHGSEYITKPTLSCIFFAIPFQPEIMFCPMLIHRPRRCIRQHDGDAHAHARVGTASSRNSQSGSPCPASSSI